MNTTTARYDEGLRQALADPAEAAAYLDAALAEGDMDGFLLALRDVAEARGRHTDPGIGYLEALCRQGDRDASLTCIGAGIAQDVADQDINKTALNWQVNMG